MIEDPVDQANTLSLLGVRIKVNLHFPTDLDKKIKIACEAYNDAVARALYGQLKQVLSRELRDIVYAHLTDEQIDICIDACHKEEIVVHCRRPPFIENPTVPYFPPRPRCEDDALRAARFWRDDIAGADVALELMESWYRNTKFTMSAYESSWNSHPDPFAISDPFTMKISTILSTDRFSQGLEPAKLIGNFTRGFYIWAECLDNNAWLLGITKSIQELTRLKFKARICLSLCFDAWTHWPAGHCDMLVKFMQIFYGEILSLRKAKYRVTVKIEKNVIPKRTFRKMLDILRFWEKKLADEA